MTRTNDPPTRRNYQAQAAFRTMCKSSGDALQDFRRWRDLYPDVTPEAFESDDRKDKDAVQRDRKAKALDLIYGKERDGEREGGFVGRGRVLNGKPYRRPCIAFNKAPELQHLAFDVSVQFDAEKMELVKPELKQQFGPGACFFVEWGDDGKGNHAHVLTTEGRSPVVPDDELPAWVGYISKKPPFTEALAVAYIAARRAAGKRALPSRHFETGCSPRTRPVPLAAIVDVLGAVPTKGKRFVKAPRQERIVTGSREQVAAAQLPLLQGGVTPEGLDAIMRLRRFWADGIFDGEPFAHGPAKMADFGFTLGYYFNRTKLFPGEVYDLEQFAIALGLHAAPVPTEVKKVETFVTRRHIRPALIAPRNAPERRPS